MLIVNVPKRKNVDNNVYSTQEIKVKLILYKSSPIENIFEQ